MVLLSQTRCTTGPSRDSSPVGTVGDVLPLLVTSVLLPVRPPEGPSPPDPRCPPLGPVQKLPTSTSPPTPLLVRLRSTVLQEPDSTGSHRRTSLTTPGVSSVGFRPSLDVPTRPESRTYRPLETEGLSRSKTRSGRQEFTLSKRRSPETHYRPL